MTSTEFIESRLKYSHLDIKSLDGSVELPDMTKKYLLRFNNIMIEGKKENGEQITFKVEIEYDPNADFDYFTFEQCTHDGTLLFVRDAILKCAYKVGTAQTLCKTKDPPYDGCTVKYTVGNFVMFSEYGKQFATNGKWWLRERTTVFLPIKYECFA